MEHARISPSAAGQWGPCPGSVSMQERYPDEESVASREGDATHWLAATSISAGIDPGIIPPGTIAPNGIIINLEMIEAATVYTEAILPVLDCDVFVENTIPVPRIHPECFGTTDAWYFIPRKWELHIWDLKYGYLIVEAFENNQGICYAAGLLDIVAEKLDQPLGLIDQFITVVFHIAQPRAWHVEGPIREWRCKASDLRAYINNLRASAHEAMAPNPRCISGAHCRYCTARHACPAGQKCALASAEYVDKATPQELTPDEMSLEWRILKRCLEAIKYRLTGLESRMIGIIDAGGYIAGCAIDKGAGRLIWDKSDQEIYALGNLMGIDIKKEVPITPTQAKKAGIPQEIIRAYSKRTPGNQRLVLTDDSLAARVFKAR